MKMHIKFIISKFLNSSTFFNGLCLLYLVLPLFIFLFGFLRIQYAFICIIILLYGLKKLITEFGPIEIFRVRPYIHLVFFLFAGLICLHTGIGDFWSQRGDSVMKHTILTDLCVRDLPLIFDLSKAPIQTQEAIGSDKVAFVYYLFYYLPSGMIGHIFGLRTARLSLLFWSTFGLYLVLLSLFCTVSKDLKSLRKAFFLITLFLCFGGFDILGDIIMHFSRGNIPDTWIYDLFFHYAEYYCQPFVMYSGNITHLDLVINQCIPCWLVAILIIRLKSLKYLVFLFSFILLYSPWATIGSFPIILGMYLIKLIENKTIKEYISFTNLLCPLLILLVVGSYYLSNSNSTTEYGFIWNFYSWTELLPKYFLFILIEIGIYLFFFLRFHFLKDSLLKISIIVLILIPFYKISPVNDFIMRGSIVGLFIVFVYWTKLVLSLISKKQMICLITVVLLFSGWGGFQNIIIKDVPIFETHKLDRQTWFNSFETIGNVNHAVLCDRQFFAHDYRDKFFWKYLSKKSN